MHSAASFLIIGACLSALCAGCCKSKPATKSDLLNAAEICVKLCPGDPAGSTTEKAMHQGCLEGCVEECEAKYPGTCKHLVK